jgi:glycosyltransferase involved in cell wall biosynthesis
MDSKVEVSVIIPFFNEEDGIYELITKIEEYYQKREFDFEIIFVDDGSTDTTSSKIKSQDFLFPCKLISLTRNFGSHAAVRAGIEHSKSFYVTCMPADFQITLESIYKLYLTALLGYDSVYATRKINEVGLIEKIFSRLYSIFMRKFAIKNFPNEGMETFFITRKVANNLKENIENNSSVFLQILSFGYKHKFISIDKLARKKGKSKWTLSKKVKLLIDSFVAFSFAPIRLVSLIGIIFFFVGVVWTSYTIFRKFMYDDLVSGWPALLSILLIGFGITNISLGIIAEYLWRTFDSSRKRPVFIIDDIIELKN